MKKKICFIVQRYGECVNGGAELHCRQVAERMAALQYDVTVLTTKAVDYMTWKNEIKEEEEILHGVTVKRFPVEKPRDQKVFNTINQEFFAGEIEHTEREEEWLEKQGPLVPKLIRFLKENKENYDVFIFFTYLYYPTVKGIPEVADKAIVIPTAHDEPFLRMDMYKTVFTEPKAIFYNTEEEKKLVESKFANQIIKSDIGGVGIEIPQTTDKNGFKEKYGVSDYILYVGRIDEGKNCHILFKYFEEYKKRNSSQLKLVLMGKTVIPIPKHKDIIYLGFVSDEEKFSGMAGAKALVLPSKFESLSMVVLEAMALKIPVLLNGECAVLKGHCLKSNAGLYYDNYFEFEGGLNYLLNHEIECAEMGRNGQQYVMLNYQWDVIIKKLEKLILYVSEGE